MQANPQTGKNVLHISILLYKPMCLCSDAPLTSR